MTDEERWIASGDDTTFAEWLEREANTTRDAQALLALGPGQAIPVPQGVNPAHYGDMLQDLMRRLPSHPQQPAPRSGFLGAIGGGMFGA